MKFVAKYLLWIGILTALAAPAFAEPRTISWAPVTTYTDGTSIETGKTVTYSAYWTTDPGLGSLRTIGTGIATTSAQFDPDAQGMTRGGTVYFTAKAVLNTGEESVLSPAYAWVVPIVTPPTVTLSGIAISGPSSVNESTTGTYAATATWSDGTTTSVTPTWTTTLGSIGASGVLTAPSVIANQTATVGASYTSSGVTRTASVSVTIVNVTATLSSIAISGPSSVNESTTGTYAATATWSDGTTTSVTPTWTTTLGSIGASGVLTAPSVTANQTATVGASYTSGGVTRTASVSVTIVNVTATLSSIAVSGPSTVNEGGTGTYTATGTWDNGTTAAITPTWSENSTYATISTGGVLTASAVTSNQPVTVTATYGGRTGTMSVTIVDVPGAAPAAAMNVGIMGPITSGTTMLWRLSWDPVTTYANGALLGPGRTVRYSAYWTVDPALSPASLRLLASSITGNLVDFDPLAYPMVKNQVIYLTVQSILDTGEQSSLAASIEWVVSNAGPAPPAGGIIIKK